MHRTNSGFTIIELVVVIVILSILAAVALPKFADIRDNAHTAKNSGTGGALAAANNIVHASWLAAGGTATSVTLEDGSVVGVGTQGWPENDNAAAPDDVVSAAECAALWTQILQPGSPDVSTTAAAADYQATIGAGADPDCLFTYQPDSTPARTITYNPNTGATVIAP